MMFTRRSVLGSLAAGMGAAGIGTAAAPGARAAAAPMVHQLGWIKSIQFGGHFAAQEQGYFAAEGITAEFLAGGPGVEPRTIVASGRAVTSDLTSTGLVLGRAQNMPLKAFAAIMQRDPNAIMSLKERPLATLQDMVGKTIALPNSARPAFSVLLKRAGIAADKVTIVPVGTDPGMLAAKQVDGYYGWATNQGIMLQSRGVDIHIAFMADLGVPGYAGVLFATEETLDKRFDDLVRWLRADIKGWRWHLDNPDQAARLVVEKYGPPGLNLQAQTAESRLMKDFVAAGDAARNGLLWIEPGVFDATIGFAKEAGALPADTTLKAGDMVTQAVVQAALKPA